MWSSDQRVDDAEDVDDSDDERCEDDLIDTPSLPRPPRQSDVRERVPLLLPASPRKTAELVLRMDARRSGDSAVDTRIAGEALDMGDVIASMDRFPAPSTRKP